MPQQSDSFDAIGLDDYGYPQVDLFNGYARITFGWFFIDDCSDEPASYVEAWVDDKGKHRFVVDVYSGFSFDFVTKLRDYGWWNDNGFGKYWVYTDGHVDFSLKHWLFRRKKTLYWWSRKIPFVQRYRKWKWQRYCKRLFKVWEK